MYSVVVFVNPIAGLNKGTAIAKQVEQFLSQHNFVFSIHYSEYAAHFDQLIPHTLSNMTQTYPQLAIVIGGDGTLHQVVNAMLSLQLCLPILYLPSGSGNDFARSHYLATDSVHTHLTKLLEPIQSCQLPLIQIKTTADPLTYAINSIGFGLDATITQIAQTIKPPHWISQGLFTRLRYLLAVLKSLKQIPHFDCAAFIQHPLSIADCQIACVLNNPYLGGGILLDPSLIAQDPVLSFVSLHSVKLKDILPLLWRIIIRSQPDTHPAYLHHHTQQLSLSIPDSSVKCQIDGEMYQFKSSQFDLSLTYYPFIL